MNKFEALSQYFGYDSFRNGQEAVVDAVLSGRDVLCVMPTGAGKSICYQVPALASEGTTLVISPLISLMKDQVQTLCAAGVPAAYINSSLTYGQYLRVVQNASEGRYKLIYAAPERLLSEEFCAIWNTCRLSVLAVDEAHCVSQWGQDFRPSYLKIIEFVERLPHRPVMAAFTATAASQVREDIRNLLRLREPYQCVTGFDRPNLYFGVLRPKKKKDALLDLLRDYQDKSGIVYCLSRKLVEDVCDMLRENGYPATRYHAGLEPEERQENQEDFLFDRKPIMVATNAFGMGIDKSNVSFVVHYNMPTDLESYYQEAGRAGRDGAPADCILLFSPSDYHTCLRLITPDEPNPELTPEQQEVLLERAKKRLSAMYEYGNSSDCLRSRILRYFGEFGTERCENCSNCLSNHVRRDITIDIQKLLSCIRRSGEIYGGAVVISILRGVMSPKIREKGLDQITTWAIMKENTADYLWKLITYCLDSGLIEKEETYGSLSVTAEGWDFLKNGGQRLMDLPEDFPVVTAGETAAKKSAKLQKKGPVEPVNEELYNVLRDLRKTLAEQEGLPPYVVATNVLLNEMCIHMPKTEEEMLAVHGMGKVRFEQYGRAFLTAIRKWNGVAPATEEEKDSAPAVRNGSSEIVSVPAKPSSAAKAKKTGSREKDDGIPWSAEEDAALREEAERYTLLEISRRHNRGTLDVFARMQILGISGKKS
ncbi:MAG: DNA helicase RecQ [Clostridia bacterium]|nr:DNA helicase RecQ [Clostridia bacterium]